MLGIEFDKISDLAHKCTDQNKLKVYDFYL